MRDGVRSLLGAIVNGADYEYITTADHAQSVVPTLMAQKALAVDTETSGLDPFLNRVLLLQIGTREKTYILDCRKVDSKIWSLPLESPSILKVLQNAKFDYKMLKMQCGITLRKFADTMIAEQLLCAGLVKKRGAPSDDAGDRLSISFGLKGLVERYLGLKLDKTLQDSFVASEDRSFTQEQLAYAARDVQVLLPIFGEQARLLKDHGMTEVGRLEMSVLSVVADMELRGWIIDEHLWRSNLEIHRQERDINGRRLLELMGYERKYQQNTMFDDVVAPEDFRPLNSVPQILNYLKTLGADLPSVDAKNVLIPYVKDLKNALDNDDRAVLDGYGGIDRVHAQIEFFDLFLKYKGDEKLVGTYGENFLKKIHPRTRRLHPEFDQMGTDTGRFSSNNPNAQNLPKHEWIRNSFRGGEGNKIVTCDYSQVELRILADQSGDPGFITAFAAGKDLHAFAASTMYGIPFEKYEHIDELPKDEYKKLKKYRSAAKAINFGLAYGLGSGGLAKQIGVSVDEAKVLIEKYFENYPSVRSFLDRSARLATTENRCRHPYAGEVGYSVTPLGRRRYFRLPDPSLRKSDPDLYRKLLSGIERAGKNAPIQGASADIVKYALIDLASCLRSYEAGIVSTVHDEICVEVPQKYAEEVRVLVEETMCKAAERILHRVVVRAESFVDDCWHKD